MFLDSLAKTIKKLQNQPRIVRVQILWLSVTISMIIVVSLWVVNLKNNMPSLMVDIEGTAEELEMPSLMSSLRETFKNAVDSFKEEEGLKELELELEKQQEDKQ